MKKKKVYEELSSLKGKIREQGKTYRSLAMEAGMRPGTLSDKLNGYSSFDSVEICKMSELLHIEANEINIYFFPCLMRFVSKQNNYYDNDETTGMRTG